MCSKFLAISEICDVFVGGCYKWLRIQGLIGVKVTLNFIFFYIIRNLRIYLSRDVNISASAVHYLLFFNVLNVCFFFWIIFALVFFIFLSWFTCVVHTIMVQYNTITMNMKHKYKLVVQSSDSEINHSLNFVIWIQFVNNLFYNWNNISLFLYFYE